MIMLMTEKYKEIVEFATILNNIKNWEDIKKIKSNFRKIREQKGLTLQYFEKHQIMQKGTLINIEKMSYRYKPNLESCIRFAYGTGCDLMELLDGIKY